MTPNEATTYILVASDGSRSVAMTYGGGTVTGFADPNVRRIGLLLTTMRNSCAATSAVRRAA